LILLNSSYITKPRRLRRRGFLFSYPLFSYPLYALNHFTCALIIEFDYFFCRSVFQHFIVPFADYMNVVDSKIRADFRLWNVTYHRNHLQEAAPQHTTRIVFIGTIAGVACHPNLVRGRNSGRVVRLRVKPAMTAPIVAAMTVGVVAAMTGCVALRGFPARRGELCSPARATRRPPYHRRAGALLPPPQPMRLWFYLASSP